MFVLGISSLLRYLGILEILYRFVDQVQQAGHSGNVDRDGISSKLHSARIQSLRGNGRYIVAYLTISMDNKKAINMAIYLLYLQKNYGHNHNVEVISEIAVRLQNKDIQAKKQNKQIEPVLPSQHTLLSQHNQVSIDYVCTLYILFLSFW